MDSKTIIQRVVTKLAEKYLDDSNTFIRSFKTDTGYVWEVGLQSEEIHKFNNEAEALEKLNDLKKSKKAAMLRKAEYFKEKELEDLSRGFSEEWPTSKDIIDRGLAKVMQKIEDIEKLSEEVYGKGADYAGKDYFVQNQDLIKDIKEMINGDHDWQDGFNILDSFKILNKKLQDHLNNIIKDKKK